MPVAYLPSTFETDSARNFVAADQQVLRTTPPILGVAPYTINAWFSPANQANLAICSLSDTSGFNDYIALLKVNGGGLRYRCNGFNIATTGNAQPNVWSMGTGVRYSSSDHLAVLNATFTASSVNNWDPSSIDRFTIGAQARSTDGSWFNGRIRELAIWKSGLRLDEIEYLWNNGRPRPAYDVRPFDLVFYDPLGRVPATIPSDLNLARYPLANVNGVGFAQSEGYVEPILTGKRFVFWSGVEPELVTGTGTFTADSLGDITEAAQIATATGLLSADSTGRFFELPLVVASSTGLMQAASAGSFTPQAAQVATATGVFASTSSGAITTSTGWTEFTPSVDTRIIYVSSSDGNDADDGLSEGNAKATLAAGVALLRDGFPDWLLLKKGDVWTNEALAPFRLSGRSDTERMLISSYGTATVRPIVRPPSGVGGLAVDVGANHLAVVGIHFHAHTRDPNSPAFIDNSAAIGIQFFNFNSPVSFDNFLIEDCYVEFFSFNVSINIRQSGGLGGPLSNFAIRRSVIVDSYTGGGHSQGLFVYGVHDALIEENVFDHNGWYEDRDTGGSISAPATSFNHNIYFDSENPDPLSNTRDARPFHRIINNVFLRASASGFQLRPGGTADQNLVVQCANCRLGYIAEANIPDGVDVDATNNVILDGVDVNSTTPLGRGFEIENLRSGFLRDNIIANETSSPTNTFALRLNSSTNHPTPEASFERNTTYSWRRGGIRNNMNAAIVLEEFNKWWDAATTPWPITGTNQHSENVDFFDPTRTVGDYNELQGGVNSVAGFAAECRQQSKDNWRTEYTAVEVNNYIRVGFLVGPGETGTGTFTADAQGAFSAEEPSTGTGTFAADAQGDLVVIREGVATGTATADAQGSILSTGVAVGSAAGVITASASGAINQIGIATGSGTGVLSADALGFFDAIDLGEATATGILSSDAAGAFQAILSARSTGMFAADASGFIVTPVSAITPERLFKIPKDNRIARF